MFHTTKQLIIHFPYVFPEILGGSTTNDPIFTIKNQQFKSTCRVESPNFS